MISEERLAYLILVGLMSWMIGVVAGPISPVIIPDRPRVVITHKFKRLQAEASARGEDSIAV